MQPDVDVDGDGLLAPAPRRKQYAWVDPAYDDPWVDHAARYTYAWGYDGTGMWPFNTAYAARYGLDAFVTRLRSLREAELFIKAGIPLVASISFGAGELDGAPISATSGHLVVIRGFTADGRVVVNDPAAPTNARCAPGLPAGPVRERLVRQRRRRLRHPPTLEGAPRAGPPWRLVDPPQRRSPRWGSISQSCVSRTSRHHAGGRSSIGRVDDPRGGEMSVAKRPVRSTLGLLVVGATAAATTLAPLDSAVAKKETAAVRHVSDARVELPLRGSARAASPAPRPRPAHCG